MANIARMTDDEVRRDLFGALVGKLEELQRKDPAIHVASRTPTVFSLRRNGNVLTVDQGAGARLLRGEIRWADSSDEDAPHRFSVSRSTDGAGLALSPGP